MVTGYGARGGRGRCFFLWQDFMKCISQAGKVSLDVCHAEREDYLECLHHNKLAVRIDAIKRQKEKLIKEGKWPRQ